MLLFIRKNIRGGVRVAYDGDPEILGITLDRTFFGLDEDIHMWFTYAPPLNSPYTKGRDMDVLDRVETICDPDCNNIMMGDLNGRTNTSLEQIEDGQDNHSPINDITSYTRHLPLGARNNMDTAPIDKQGKYIVSKCKSLGLRILNGRTKGDRTGAFTRFPLQRNEKPSVIDYGLCSHDLADKVTSFRVQPFDGTSDHCCISTSITTSFHDSVGGPDSGESLPAERPPPFVRDLSERYKENLDNNGGLQKLDEALTSQGEVTQSLIDSWADSFNQIIATTAASTFPSGRAGGVPRPPKTGPKSKNKKPQQKTTKWYSEECRKAKFRLKSLIRSVGENPLDRNIRERLIGARKAYKTTCRKAESSFRKRMLSRLLAEDDPKKFWEIISKMRDWGSTKPDPSSAIPPDQWKEHFTKLLNTDKREEFVVPEGIPLHEMDGCITKKELESALAKAKDGKAFGPDLIIMEYIKHASSSAKATLLTLIHAIYVHALYPTLWTTNYLKAIYKKGAKTDPNNYRGLAIGPALGKLYSLILLERLETYAEDNNIISKFQIAFRKGFRTADHVYVLKTLVTKLVTQGGGKLFAAFIDFKKAYDTVNPLTPET